MFALHLFCKREEVDEVSTELWEAGAEGIQEIDFAHGLRLIAGFSDGSRREELTSRFAFWEPRWERQPDTDWVAETQAAWPPREVGSRILLAPAWFAGEVPNGRVAVIHNPGTASGTGEHPCTQLVLEALEKIPLGGARVLDVGAGSGILAISALSLGAAWACGIDIDVEALETARENFQLNRLRPILAAGSCECVRGASFDVVLANISGTVLLSIFEDLLRMLRPGGQIVLSGFEEGEAGTFVELVSGAELTSRDGWSCVSGRLV